MFKVGQRYRLTDHEGLINSSYGPVTLDSKGEFVVSSVGINWAEGLMDGNTLVPNMLEYYELVTDEPLVFSTFVEDHSRDDFIYNDSNDVQKGSVIINERYIEVDCWPVDEDNPDQGWQKQALLDIIDIALNEYNILVEKKDG